MFGNHIFAPKIANIIVGSAYILKRITVMLTSAYGSKALFLSMSNVLLHKPEDNSLNILFGALA